MLIVDMPMPKNCGECPLLYMEIVKCTVNGNDCTEYGSERPSWCPIKGVLPEEHGDLVDTDTVLWEVLDSEGIETAMPVTVGDVIEGYDVPIVIAAERKDDE